MIYSFLFVMAMTGELCCFTILGVELLNWSEKRLKTRLKANEKFMKWLEETK